MDPLPELNRIFSIILQHERQQGFAPVEDSKALKHVVGYKKSNSKLGSSSA